ESSPEPPLRNVMSDAVKKKPATPASSSSKFEERGEELRQDKQIEILINGVRVEVSPELEAAVHRAYQGLLRPLPREMTTTRAAPEYTLRPHGASGRRLGRLRRVLGLSAELPGLPGRPRPEGRRSASEVDRPHSRGMDTGRPAEPGKHLTPEVAADSPTDGPA